MTSEQVPAKTATFLHSLDDWIGDAAKYQLSSPHEGYDYVIVSAANVPLGGPETYIFPAVSDSDVPAEWIEMPGSFKGAMDHEAALENAGYVLAPKKEDVQPLIRALATEAEHKDST